MLEKYVLLATEGSHDQAVLGKMLSLFGLKKYGGRKNDLEPFWESLIPTYPKKGNYYTRLDMPSIYSSSTHSVAIYQGEGSNLLNNLQLIFTAFPQYTQNISSFGIIADADDRQPGQIVARYATGLREFFPAIANNPGVITSGKPKTGIYIFPDNNGTGVLDSVLVKCASVVYPDHKSGAEHFINTLPASHKAHWRPFDQQKSIVASITSILRPGMSNTPSLAQDNWIGNETLQNVIEVTMLKAFLEGLLELTTTTDETHIP